MTNLTASLYFYPAARSGLFVTGGLGLANYHIIRSILRRYGLGVHRGAGYDIRRSAGTFAHAGRELRVRPPWAT